MTQTPALLCYPEGSNELETCSREVACESPDSFKIDYDDHFTIRNFITDMDLICVENYSFFVSNFGVLLLLGIVLGCIAILPLADIYGRRKMLLSPQSSASQPSCLPSTLGMFLKICSNLNCRYS